MHGQGGAVGVGGQAGRFGQHVEAGEEPEAAVHAPQVVGAVAAEVGQFQGEEGEHGGQGWERAGGRIGGPADGLVEAVGADPRQEAERAGGALGLKSLAGVGREQGTGGCLQRGGGRGGAFGLAAAGQACEAFVAQDAPDVALAGSVVEFGIEARFDVGQGEIELAQSDDALLDTGGRIRLLQAESLDHPLQALTQCNRDRASHGFAG